MGIGTRGYHPAISAMHASMQLRAELAEAKWEQIEKLQENQKLKKSYWVQRQSSALADLRALDPLGWSDWYNSDAVPDFGTIRERALIIEARVRELLGNRPVTRVVARLYRGVFVWFDSRGCFVYGEDGKIYEFTSEAEAHGHIDATLEMCGKLLGALA